MSAFFFLLMRVYDRPSVSRARETVVAGPSSEPDAEMAGTDKGKARADSSAVGPAGMQFAPSDPSIHDRPFPESAGLPATPPRPGIINPEFRGPNNEDEVSSLDNHPPNSQSRRVTPSSFVIADSPGPLYYDEQGVVHVVDEDIDAMLSRLDDERRASGDSGRGAEMPEGVALPAGGIDWVPPNILLEYDWIQDIGAETVDDEGQPAPPPLRYGLRLFRRFTRVFPPVAEQDDGRPLIPRIAEQEPQDDGRDEPAVVDQ